MDVYKLWTCDDNSESQLSSTSSEIEKEIDVLRKTFDFCQASESGQSSWSERLR